MKLISYRAAGPTVHVGAVTDETVHELDAVVSDLPVDSRAAALLAEVGARSDSVSMQKLLLAGHPGLERVRQALAKGDVPATPLADVQLLAPVPRPGKVLGVGRNYGAHARESGSGPLEQPRIFTKVASSAQPSGSRIHIPDPIVKPDFEVELAVVIGSFTRDVTEQEALGRVVGYTVLNDMSAREFQFDVAPPQTSFAKSFDGATPMGPWIVTADEIPDPQQLALRCEINGEVLQEDTTAGMIFPVAFLVSYLSRFMTLEPGDVIATGTPSGVGAFRKPPRWLKSGDRVRLVVERIGTLEHWIA